MSGIQHISLSIQNSLDGAKLKVVMNAFLLSPPGKQVGAGAYSTPTKPFTFNDNFGKLNTNFMNQSPFCFKVEGDNKGTYFDGASGKSKELT